MDDQQTYMQHINTNYQTQNDCHFTKASFMYVIKELYTQHITQHYLTKIVAVK